MKNMIKDPMFMYSIAFVIFVALAIWKGRKPVTDWIDGEIQKIRDELDQAQALRKEAEATLAEYKVKQAVALAEAEMIVKNAKESAITLRAQAESDLKNALARHEQQAIDRIRLAETEAMAQVRVAAIDLAVSMARKSLTSQMDEATASKLIDQAIADMPKPNAAKAKAA